MQQQDSNLTGFTEEIEQGGHYYNVEIRYSFPLTEEERKMYKVEDGEFFIELTDATGTKSFKVFQDESLQWKSDAPPLSVDQKLVEAIGSCIDSRLEYRISSDR
jgi:hypothetical protein